MRGNFSRPVSVITCAFFLLSTVSAYGLPQGEQVVSGQATFDRSQADTLNVNVTTDRMIAEYNGFSIAQSEAVNFSQPSAQSIALNRVVGGDPSSILGTLTANGRIFLVNPNGVVFGRGCTLDTAGLVASTLNISNEDFLAGRYVFTGKGGSIVNQGYITSPGGFVALLGSTVENSGTIEATLGSIALAAGEAVTLNLDAQGIISVVVDEALTDNDENKDAAVDNSGTLSANGGRVILSAKTLDDIFANAINTDGIIEADAIDDSTGLIELRAEGNISSSGLMSADKGMITLCTDDTLSLRGTYTAESIIFDPEWITQTGNLYLSGNTTFYSAGDINVTDDIYNGSGFLHFFADALDETNTRDDGTGDFVQDDGTVIAATGGIEISGVNVTTDDLVSGDGIAIHADTAYTQRAGSTSVAAGNVTINGGTLILGNIYFGGDDFSAQATTGDIEIIDAIISAEVSIDIKTLTEYFSTTLYPTDDSTTKSILPGSNYGTYSTLFSRSNGSFGSDIQLAWLKFDLSSIPDNATVSSALLNVYVRSGSSSIWIGAFHAPDNWSESTINWNNQPVPDTVSASGHVVSYGFNSWDVTGDVNSDNTSGDDQSAWVLQRDDPVDAADSSAMVYFKSKEYPGTDYDPNMTINYYTRTGSADYTIGDIHDGTITLTAQNDVIFKDSGTLQTNGSASISAIQGAIIDQTGTQVNVTANSLVLSAGKGIGPDDPLDTSVARLAARVTGSTASGNIDIKNTRTGGMEIVDPASWNYALRNAGSGKILITHSSDLYIKDLVETQGGDVSLSAGGNILHTADGDVVINRTASSAVPEPENVTSTSHSASTWSNDDTIDMQWMLRTPEAGRTGHYFASAGGTYTMETNSSVTTNGGDATINAGGDIALSMIDAGNAVVKVTSASGSITDSDLGTAGGSGPFPLQDDLDIIANTILLSAPNGSIGGSADGEEIDMAPPVEFSYLGDLFDTTVPDTVVDTYAAAPNSEGRWVFSTTLTVPVDTDNWWFHILSVDNGGNTSSAVHTGPFFIDTTAPVIFAGIPVGLAGTNGWWRSDVTVPFSATDNLSGFEPSGDLTVTLSSKTTSGEGTALFVTSDGITDRAGNAATVITAGPFKVDMTSPVITAGTPSGIQRSDGTWASDVTVPFSATDNLSGFAPAGALYTDLAPKTAVGPGEGLIVTSDGIFDMAGNFAPGIPAGPFTIVFPSEEAAFASFNQLRYFRAYYELLNGIRVVFADPARPTEFYAYHPLTPTDMAAFDDIVLDAGAYEFISGNINAKKRFSPYFGEDNKKKKVQ